VVQIGKEDLGQLLKFCMLRRLTLTYLRISPWFWTIQSTVARPAPPSTAAAAIEHGSKETKVVGLGLGLSLVSACVAFDFAQRCTIHHRCQGPAPSASHPRLHAFLRYQNLIFKQRSRPHVIQEHCRVSVNSGLLRTPPLQGMKTVANRTDRWSRLTGTTTDSGSGAASGPTQPLPP
jgi:hypothetical protein